MNTPWIETASGLYYHFLNPSEDEIKIEDIALSLANKCRFSGHTQFFSVAEHCLSVAYRLPPELRLAGLLHDAAEAYLGDIPSPIKQELLDYLYLEKINETIIEKKFNLQLSSQDRIAIKTSDLQALYTEAHYLLPSKGKDWGMFEKGFWEIEPEFRPQCLPPVFAYAEFMRAYEDFTGTGRQLKLIGV